MTARDWNHDELPYDEGDHHQEASGHSPAPQIVLGLGILCFGLGGIGMATGFATVLGLSATASGGAEVAGGFGALAAVAASSLVLGGLLIAGGVLLWRAHRAAKAVIGVATALVAVSSLARIALDEISFVSVVGSTFSVLALILMWRLLSSDGVRAYLATGRPVRLR